MNAAFADLAGIIVNARGVAHIMPTRKVVAGFGPLSNDNRLAVIIEWVAEGMTLIFPGLLAALVTIRGGARNDVAVSGWAITAGMLVAMAAWTVLTGARGSAIFFKLRPIVKTTAAILLVAVIAV
jgi:hypothetical protein